jgi:hypothetical protein
MGCFKSEIWPFFALISISNIEKALNFPLLNQAIDPAVFLGRESLIHYLQGVHELDNDTDNSQHICNIWRSRSLKHMRA